MLGVVHYNTSSILPPLHLQAYDCSELILHHTCTNFTANHPRLHFHLLPLPISICQSISSTLSDDSTGHTPQFREYLIFFIICKRLSGSLALFASIRSMCPGLHPFIIIKHDLTHRLGPSSSPASFLFSLL